MASAPVQVGDGAACSTRPHCIPTEGRPGIGSVPVGAPLSLRTRSATSQSRSSSYVAAARAMRSGASSSREITVKGRRPARDRGAPVPRRQDRRAGPAPVGTSGALEDDLPPVGRPRPSWRGVLLRDRVLPAAVGEQVVPLSHRPPATRVARGSEAARPAGRGGPPGRGRRGREAVRADRGVSLWPVRCHSGWRDPTYLGWRLSGAWSGRWHEPHDELGSRAAAGGAGGRC